ncbi:MAG TPA: hypothetical protein VMQ65_03085 [Candidatus Limnocylindria bacterium]|nr:hypothetical protein [Candidatus Limnocylindria bacterium]
MAALVFLTVGCTGDDRASGQCVAAFRDATPRAGAPQQASPLDDAIRTCESVEAWTDAWNRVPDAHPPAKEAIPYLRERCLEEELRLTAVCLDVQEDSALVLLPGAPVDTH